MLEACEGMIGQGCGGKCARRPRWKDVEGLDEK